MGTPFIFLDGQTRLRGCVNAEFGLRNAEFKDGEGSGQKAEGERRRAIGKGLKAESSKIEEKGKSLKTED
jgi:hypothetical protein